MPYFYIGNCTDLPGQDISEMVDTAQPIGYSAFVRNVGEEKIKELFPDYNWTRTGTGPRMRNSPYFTYGKGVFQETPVYFVKHSGMEYIFEERFR